MYCTKCGKQIDYDAPLCLECTAEMAKQARDEKKLSENATPAPQQSYESAPQQTYTAPQQTYTAPQQTYTAPQQTYVAQRPDTRKEGIGKAICSLVLACCISFVGGLAIGFMISELVGAAVFFTLATIAMGVVSIVNGAMSIKTFVNVKNAGNPLPIPTLILGIVGLAVTVISLLVCIVYYFAAASMML